MADITYTRTVAFNDYVDGETIVSAGGADGFNVRFHSIEQELDNKALPEGRTPQAVAGYLYFPRPSKKKNEELSLTWYAPQGNPVRLTLSAAK